MLYGRKPISHIVRHGLALCALLSNPHRCSNIVRLKVPEISLQIREVKQSTRRY